MSDLLINVSCLKKLSLLMLMYLDINSRLEGSFLCVVALQSNAMLVVPDGVSRNRRMMTERIALAKACIYQCECVRT